MHGDGMYADGTDVGRRDRGGSPGRGRRAAAILALILGLVGLAVSMTGVAIQLLPRQFSAGQQRQIEAWEVMRRWQTMPAGQIFPASVSYQLSAQVLQDAAPLDLDALRVSIAPQESDCAKAVTSAAAGAVLRRNGCEAVLRATYVDATRSYVMTVGVAVLPTEAAAASAASSLSPARLAAAHDAVGVGRLSAGVRVVRFRGAAARLYDYNRQISASFTAGPYVVMYAAGYSDSRPRVPVIPGRVLRRRDEQHGAGRRAFRREHARRQPRPAALPGHTRMLNQGWRPGLAVLAAFGVMSLAALPGPASAAVRREGGEFAGSATADDIRDSQQWVLGMLNAEAAWSVTQGAGVTVAVIDSGVNPYVSDLAGSVVTGPDYTGVTTSPASKDWGIHGTWMASLIAGHGHDGGLSGVIGIAPEARILSVRVIPDRQDPHYGKYEREAETAHPAVAGRRDRLRGDARRAGHQHVDRLQRAERHGQGSAAAGLRPRRGGDRLRRELGRPGRTAAARHPSPSPPTTRA